MTKLSVNVNKIATLRNARGGNVPNLIQVVKDIQSYGAQGITVHPRPDERHIKYADAKALKEVVYTEYNIEGNPVGSFVDLVNGIVPTQVTLVPDSVDAITSDAGWDTVSHAAFLTEMIQEFKSKGIRTSIFVDPVPSMIEGAAKVGTDRIELYTEAFADGYSAGNLDAIAPYTRAAELAHKLGLGINAGHDLSLENIAYFVKNVPHVAEVSIGHALISEALYIGLEQTVQEYLKKMA